VEIDAAHVRQPDENELPRERRYPLIETNNLLVEALAVGSPLSAEYDQQRFAGLAGESLSCGIIVKPCRTRRKIVGPRPEARGQNAQPNTGPEYPVASSHGCFTFPQ
jgi:hypothetical protein